MNFSNNLKVFYSLCIGFIMIVMQSCSSDVTFLADGDTDSRSAYADSRISISVTAYSASDGQEISSVEVSALGETQSASSALVLDFNPEDMEGILEVTVSSPNYVDNSFSISLEDLLGQDAAFTNSAYSYVVFLSPQADPITVGPDGGQFSISETTCLQGCLDSEQLSVINDGSSTCSTNEYVIDIPANTFANTVLLQVSPVRSYVFGPGIVNEAEGESIVSFDIGVYDLDQNIIENPTISGPININPTFNEDHPTIGATTVVADGEMSGSSILEDGSISLGGLQNIEIVETSRAACTEEISGGVIKVRAFDNCDAGSTTRRPTFRGITFTLPPCSSVQTTTIEYTSSITGAVVNTETIYESVPCATSTACHQGG